MLLVKPADYDLAKLTLEWKSFRGSMERVGRIADRRIMNEWRDYKDMKGNPHRTPLWQIGLHVVNHATHHRGQVSGFLRSLGKTPPPLDLIYYYGQETVAA